MNTQFGQRYVSTLVCVCVEPLAFQLNCVMARVLFIGSLSRCSGDEFLHVKELQYHTNTVGQQ